jgi:potassium-transporting ATPase KdpC subunit
MKKDLQIAIRFTLVTAVLFGLAYPLVVTGLSQWLFPHQSNGSLITRDRKIIGSQLIGQTFLSDSYFHSRPSSAGDGYDAANSSGSNLAPTNHALVERVQADVAKLRAENPNAPIPVDLVTTSGSGLDPHISPAAAEFQVARVARARKIPQDSLRALVAKHTEARQFGVFGEPRVNVLELNLDLDSAFPAKK